MARPKGSKNKVSGGPAAKPAAAGAGHNSQTMSDDQLQSLTRQHMLKRISLIAAEQKAKADRMNFDKVIKSDLGDKGLDNIKLLIKLETPEGEKAIKEDLERQAMVARWAGLQIGTQGSLFEDDRRALVDRAYEDGKRVGMKGGDCQPPYGQENEAGQKWIEGWHFSQSLRASEFKSTKKTPDAEIIKTNPAPENAGGPDDFDAAANGGAGGDTAGEGKGDEDGAPWPDDEQIEGKTEDL